MNKVTSAQGAAPRKTFGQQSVNYRDLIDSPICVVIPQEILREFGHYYGFKVAQAPPEVLNVTLDKLRLWKLFLLMKTGSADTRIDEDVVSAYFMFSVNFRNYIQRKVFMFGSLFMEKKVDENEFWDFPQDNNRLKKPDEGIRRTCRIISEGTCEFYICKTDHELRDVLVEEVEILQKRNFNYQVGMGLKAKSFNYETLITFLQKFSDVVSAKADNQKETEELYSQDFKFKIEKSGRVLFDPTPLGGMMEDELKTAILALANGLISNVQEAMQKGPALSGLVVLSQLLIPLNEIKNRLDKEGIYEGLYDDYAKIASITKTAFQSGYVEESFYKAIEVSLYHIKLMETLLKKQKADVTQVSLEEASEILGDLFKKLKAGSGKF